MRGVSLYTLLYALSVVLINPWGESVGAIWTAPKVYILTAILLLNLFSLVRYGRSSLGTAWRRAALLWAALLSVGLATTFVSPAPQRSFLGQSALGDGWLYWALVAGVVLSNALLLRAKPALFRAQLLGLLLGGGLFALSIFPQVFSDTVDYTATSGQKVGVQRLESGIHTEYQPIGLTSSRGHASVVVALTLMLALVSLSRGWARPGLPWSVLGAAGVALWFTDSRGGVAAALLGLLYLGGWALKTRRKGAPFAAALLLLVLGWGVYAGAGALTRVQARDMPELRASVSELTSGRLEMWRQALWAVRQRPVRGYGFGGFGTAWPYIATREDDPEDVRSHKVLWIGDETYSYRSGGEVYVRTIPTFHDKAHTLVLDWLLAVGVVGFALYAGLLGYLLLITARGPAAPLEVLTVAYLGFTLTWYDAAQFSHLAFWGLSVGLGFAGLGTNIDALTDRDEQL